MSLRTPIITVLGHVNHGKTTLLDMIIGKQTANNEAGSITQTIRTHELEKEGLKKWTAETIDESNVQIPGILFVDTPGHTAFTSIRQYGQALADYAILVIDIIDGIQPQTEEALRHIMESQTPFVIALNKIDRVPGWKTQCSDSKDMYKEQSAKVQSKIDEATYDIVGKIGESYGVNSDYYWKIKDYSDTVPIVPLSAKTGGGISSLMTVLTGMSQKYLQENIELEPNASPIGTIINIKNEKGFGETAEVILENGTIETGEKIEFSTLNDSKVTEVQRILSNGSTTNTVTATSVIEIEADDISTAVVGTRLLGLGRKIDYDESFNVSDNINLDEIGIIIKSDTVGSLEAVVETFQNKNVDVMEIGVGEISKSDILLSKTVKDKKKRIIVGFNVGVTSSAMEALDDEIYIIQDNVIHNLEDKYDEYLENVKKEEKRQILEQTDGPGAGTVLKNYIFSEKNPAVFGVEVTHGTISEGETLEKLNGDEVGYINEIQKDGQKISSATKGQKVSISVEGITIGNDISPGESFRIKVRDGVISALSEYNEISIPDKDIDSDILEIYT